MITKQHWALGWTCVVCLAGCGDDPAPRAGKDAGAEPADAGSDERVDASMRPLDAGVDSGNAGRDAALDAGANAGSALRATPPKDEDPDDLPGKTVTIRFRATVGSEPFVCDRAVTIPGLGTVDPHDFRFYVQDLALIDAAGKEVPVRMINRAPHQLQTVALIDFETGTGSCGGSTNVNSEIIGKVPEGQYRGVVFSNGVPVELNHEDPTTFPPPLTDVTMYWDWFSGFKFFVAEVRPSATAPGESAQPDDEDAGAAPPQSILHIGSSACSVAGSGDIQCSRSYRNRIRLAEFDPDGDVITADLAALFADVPATDTFCHGGRAGCAKVYRNLGLDLATGNATDTQRVYRVD